MLQVAKLQSQADEHRVIKERLQAAVTAALSGDEPTVQPVQQALEALPTAGQPDSSVAIRGEVADLQHAVSTLHVSVMPCMCK